MPVTKELHIHILPKDYDKLFPEDKGNYRQKVIHYGLSHSSYHNGLPAKFLGIFRGSKQDKYSYEKDMELWHDYCTWCDIVTRDITMPVVIRGDY